MTSEEVTELLWQHAASITHDKEKVNTIGFPIITQTWLLY